MPSSACIHLDAHPRLRQSQGWPACPANLKASADETSLRSSCSGTCMLVDCRLLCLRSNRSVATSRFRRFIPEPSDSHVYRAGGGRRRGHGGAFGCRETVQSTWSTGRRGQQAWRGWNARSGDCRTRRAGRLQRRFIGCRTSRGQSGVAAEDLLRRYERLPLYRNCRKDSAGSGRKTWSLFFDACSLDRIREEPSCAAELRIRGRG